MHKQVTGRRVAAFFSEADLQRVRDGIDIVSLIREYVPLKRSGSAFKALCPFHQEKTPSFFVVPSKQIFKCFGCGAAGDAISFLMKHDGIDFTEAVRALAKRTGIQITESPVERTRRTARQKVHEANRWAVDFFRAHLSSQAGAHARKYLEERRIAPQMVKTFQLGCAPAEWDTLVRKAQAEKLDLQLLTEAGLIMRRREGGYRDLFRNRLMFPIHDARGEVLGFGARSLDGSEPKYLNSPETPVFNKSKALYGINLAAQPMQKSGRKRRVLTVILTLSC